MKYVPPYGISDPNASYVNGDPSIARQGSIPPAEAFEHPMREITNVISKNKFIPSAADLMQMVEANRSQRVNFAKDTGSTNNLSVAYDPPLSAYTIGLPLRVQVHSTNTGGVTIDAGAGRVGCKRPDGSNIQPGDMPAGGIVDLVFDGTFFQMVNYLGGASTGSITNVFNNIPYAVDSSTTPNKIIAHFTPAITAVSAGSVVLIKINNTCTQDTTVDIDALVGMPIRVDGALAGGRLLPGDVIKGDVKLFVYDGTNWYIDPNVVVPDDVTVNVPSTQFPDVATTLKMLGRKTIAPTARLTVKLASGVYPPITLSHPCAQCITIQGTMIGAAPGLGEWGSSAAGNVAMCRTRYGTEIHAYNNTVGFINVGPGCPLLKDLFIIGDRSGSSGGIFVNVSYPLAVTLETENVAIAYCTWGVYGSGAVRLVYGGITGCYIGAATHGGFFSAYGTAFNANDSWGVSGDMCSTVGLQSCYAMWNGYGVLVGMNSSGGLSGAYAYNAIDVMAYVNSACSVGGSAVYTMSPPLNTEGNFNSMILG